MENYYLCIYNEELQEIEYEKVIPADKLAKEEVFGLKDYSRPKKTDGKLDYEEDCQTILWQYDKARFELECLGRGHGWKPYCETKPFSFTKEVK
jgi:hypothetical protein